MGSRGELELLNKREAQIREYRRVLSENLPHKYGHKWYQWQRAFFQAKEKVNLLTAANQIGKSTVQIWKCIEWATNKALWPDLWDTKPVQFWYLYPDADTAFAEWTTKWKQWMPQGPLKDHPEFGWKEDASKREILSVTFNSGVILFFKTYGQNVHNLQAGTVHAEFCFPRGTTIIAKKGLVPIESLQVGDLVLSKDGWKPVTKLMSRQAPVIERTFSNGTKIRATENHPFHTRNRGWIPFGELLPSDECATVPAWKLIKKFSCFKGVCSSAVQRAKTFVYGTISAIAGTAEPFTSPFGKLITAGASPKVTSSITSTSTPSTTALRTFSSLRGLSTLGFTKKTNGERLASTTSPARSAAKTSSREAPRRPFLATALWPAVDSGKRALASFVARRFKAGSIFRPARVLGHARTLCGSDLVFNLTVADSHTYFAEGLLVHNCDEELPVELWDELIVRMEDTKGYFNSVFTPTRNQLFWYLAMECIGQPQEKLKDDSFKINVSAYDCLVFDDGTPGRRTEEQVQKAEARCRTKAEVQRRIFGRFVTEEGRLFPTFDPTVHLMAPRAVPDDWKIYSGVDIGSGGTSHPAAIIFVAVDPEGTQGEVFLGWRGDDVTTTNGDIFQKYVELRGGMDVQVQAYDSQAKDFVTISDRAGENFQKAEKAQDFGYGLVNTLFQTGALRIHSTDELQKLANELMTVMEKTPKSNAKDDFCDALRFACATAIPWDWAALQKTEKKVTPTRDLTPQEREIKERRGELPRKEVEGWQEFEDELSYWNDQY